MHVQELGTESLGTCTDFQAVPGCGIRCQVSNTEMLSKHTESDTDDNNQRNSMLVQFSDTVTSTSSHSLIMDPRPLSTLQSRHSFLLYDVMLFKCRVSAGYAVLIGNREWMKRNGLQVRHDIDDAMTEHEQRGCTAVLVAVDSECWKSKHKEYHLFIK